jgi:hypothetical protein
MHKEPTGIRYPFLEVILYEESDEDPGIVKLDGDDFRYNVVKHFSSLPRLSEEDYSKLLELI